MDGAVVVLYNPEEDDFTNILDYAGKVDITLIIDNSPVNNKHRVEQYISVDGEKVLYHHYQENVGLCKAMNTGLLYLKKLGCEWAFTMNSDSSFKTDIISCFRNFISTNQTSDIVILTPQFNYDRHRVESYVGEKKVKWAMMSGNYVNLEAFEKLGGFFEDFFVDGLDIEFCLRARKNNYLVVECGEAILEHLPGEAKKFEIFGKTIFESGVYSPQRCYYQARSLTFIIKEFRSINEIKLFIWKFVKIFLLFSNKRIYIRKYIEGTKDGLKMRY